MLPSTNEAARRCRKCQAQPLDLVAFPDAGARVPPSLRLCAPPRLFAHAKKVVANRNSGCTGRHAAYGTEPPFVMMDNIAAAETDAQVLEFASVFIVKQWSLVMSLLNTPLLAFLECVQMHV